MIWPYSLLQSHIPPVPPSSPSASLATLCPQPCQAPSHFTAFAHAGASAWGACLRLQSLGMAKNLFLRYYLTCHPSHLCCYSLPSPHFKKMITFYDRYLLFIPVYFLFLVQTISSRSCQSSSAAYCQ